MKLTVTILFIVASFPLASSASVIITGDKLNVGYSNATGGAYSGSFGNNNFVDQDGAIAIGAYNQVSQDDNDYGSFALGHHNYIHGYGSIVGGSYNSVLDDSSFTAGFYNYNNAPASLVVGRGNVVEYTQNQDSITAGRYNAAVSYNKPAHLVVGNGTSSTTRKNSFIVYADGDIVITKPQGDISMGAYD